MIKVHIMAVVMILISVTIFTFAQKNLLPPSNEGEVSMKQKKDYQDNGEYTRKQKLADIVLIKEKVSKLKVGMTTEEVYDIMNVRPTILGSGRSIPTYFFKNGLLDLGVAGYGYNEGLRLTLGYSPEQKLIAVYNNDGFDLFSSQYQVNIADFSVSIDDGEVLNLSQVVTINQKNYLALEDITKHLGINASWDKELQQKEYALVKKRYAEFYNAVDKLKKGMTKDEVIELLGKPKNDISDSTYRYLYGKNQKLSINFGYADGYLYRITTNEGFDLLKAKYIPAIVIKTPIFIDDKELIILNPLVAIDEVVYVPLDDFVELIGIKVRFNKDKKHFEIITK